MKRKLLFAIIFLTVFSLSTKSAKADYGCEYGQYGGCIPSQSILIDKTVYNGSSYVDNMSASDTRFAPQSQITFRLRVKNTSSTNLTNVMVKDYVPGYLEPIEGPGTYDTSTRIITFNAGDFNADEEKTYFIKMQAAAQGELPSDKSLICEVNKAEAYNGSVSDEDTSQFCNEKQVIGVTKVPSSGPDFGLAIISINLVGGAIGFWLKKKSVPYN